MSLLLLENSQLLINLLQSSRRSLSFNFFDILVCALSSGFSGVSYCNRILSYSQNTSSNFLYLNDKRRIQALLEELPTEEGQRKTHDPAAYQTDPSGVVTSLSKIQRNFRKKSPLRIGQILAKKKTVKWEILHICCKFPGCSCKKGNKKDVNVNCLIFLLPLAKNSFQHFPRYGL